MLVFRTLLVRMRGNTDHKNSEYGYFSRSDINLVTYLKFWKFAYRYLYWNAFPEFVNRVYKRFCPTILIIISWNSLRNRLVAHNSLKRSIQQYYYLLSLSCLLYFYYHAYCSVNLRLLNGITKLILNGEP